MNQHQILGNLLQNGISSCCSVCFNEFGEIMYSLDCIFEEFNGKSVDNLLKFKCGFDLKNYVEEGHLCSDCFSELELFLRFSKKVESAKKILKLYKQTQDNLSTEFNEAEKEEDQPETELLIIKEEIDESEYGVRDTAPKYSVKKYKAVRSELVESRKTDNIKFVNLKSPGPSAVLKQKIQNTHKLIFPKVLKSEASNESNSAFKNQTSPIKSSTSFENPYTSDRDNLDEAYSDQESQSSSHKSEALIMSECGICSQKMEYGKIGAHRKYHHPQENIYQCIETKCKFTFRTYKELKEHDCRDQAEREADPAFQLKKIQFLEQKAKVVMKRRNVSNAEKTHVCEICGKAFSTAQQLKKHALTHSNIKTVFCPICGKGFTQSGGLYAHKLVHQKNFKFTCDKCGRKYQRKEDLKYHLRLHINAKPFACTICSKRFNKNSNLTSHMKSVHTSGDEKYQFSCHICSLRVTSQYRLKIHIEKHSKDKVYYCEICNKEFYHPTNLTRHKKTHLGVKYDCDICNTSFTRKEKLKIHKRVHTNECPYQCTYCDNSFRNLEYLKRHQRVHGIPYVRHDRIVKMRKDKSEEYSECQAE